MVVSAVVSMLADRLAISCLIALIPGRSAQPSRSLSSDPASLRTAALGDGHFLGHVSRQAGIQHRLADDTAHGVGPRHSNRWLKVHRAPLGLRLSGVTASSKDVLLGRALVTLAASLLRPMKRARLVPGFRAVARQSRGDE